MFVWKEENKQTEKRPGMAHLKNYSNILEPIITRIFGLFLLCLKTESHVYNKNDL